MNARFQTIQSAHEVLTDPEQRAKYDVGRSRGSGIPGGFASQARPASGFARGNPWANVATDFPPPPRASRSRAQAPPPSAGAQRYANNFKPGSGAYGSASSGARPSDDDGAEARKKTYEAWSKMRGGKAPPPYNPHGYQPTPGTDERRSSRQQAPKPQPPPIPKRTGYAPGAAGGDEPAAANTSAYYTQRAGRAPTAKQQPPPQKTPPRAAPADPLRQFREKTGTPLEPRLSTPYASHGGEKTDPFESVNFGRSNSTRAPSGRADASRSSGSPRNRERHRSASPSRPSRTSHLSPELNAGSRVGSDTNLNTSPKRTFSRATRASNMSEPRKPVVDYSSSSSDESEEEPSGSFGTRERVYAKSRSRRTQAQATPAGTSRKLYHCICTVLYNQTNVSQKHHRSSRAMVHRARVDQTLTQKCTDSLSSHIRVHNISAQQDVLQVWLSMTPSVSFRAPLHVLLVRQAKSGPISFRRTRISHHQNLLVEAFSTDLRVA